MAVTGDAAAWPASEQTMQAQTRAPMASATISSHTSPKRESRAHLGGAATYLDDLEAQEALVEHDDLVLVGTLVHHAPQGQQLLLVGEHGAPPGRVTLVADDHFLLKGLDGLVEDHWVLILIRARELVLWEESTCGLGGD